MKALARFRVWASAVAVHGEVCASGFTKVWVSAGVAYMTDPALTGNMDYPHLIQQLRSFSIPGLISQMFDAMFLMKGA